MSDVYNFSDAVRERQYSAQGLAISSITDDPEKASRAVDLEKITGTPAAAIYHNLDGFEEGHKRELISGLFEHNPHLQEYVNSHPLASKVSNDDWGQLDAASQKIQNLATVLGKGPLGEIAASVPDMIDIAKEGLASIAQFGTQSEAAKELGGNVEKSLIASGMDPALAKQEAEHQAKTFSRGEDIQTVAFGLPTLALSPILGIFRHSISKPIERATGFPHAGVEQAAMVLASFFGLKDISKLPKQAPEIHDAISAAEPFIRNGEEPPIGVHPILDDLKIAKSDEELKLLDEALKESQASQTKERNPGMYAEFARQHTDGKIGISGEKIAELYGDKPPSADDNLLGWVPDIKEQLDSALASGGDVQIPIADWLAKVDPAVAKELRDFTRVRPGGVTKEEGKVLAEQAKAMVEAYHGSPHDFEAFSMEKIGTGEGAQSYGHGLYFAENPTVANQYATATTQRALSNSSFTTQRVAEYLRAARGDRAKAIQEAQKDLEHKKKNDPSRVALTEGVLEELKAGSNAPSSNRYRVRIHADKEQFLDWDKPLTPENREAFAKLLPDRADYFRDETSSPSGQSAYEELTKGIYKNQQQASKALHEAGIPGIKYLDQGSRGKTEGTHNFVLFDESLIEITHKNDVELVRKAAALNPIFQRKLELRKLGSVMDSTTGQPMHAFNLFDQQGKVAATLNIAEENGGKRLYVDDIRGVEGQDKGQAFGPRAMREVLEQLKAEFPKAETLEGFRVSGARDKAGSWEEKGKVSIKLSANLEDEIAKLYEEHGQWEDVGAGYETKRIDFNDAKQGKEIIDAVDAEIAKLKAFDIDIEPVEGIREQKTGDQARGVYLTYKGYRPAILFAIGADDPVGVVRHEVIHDLKARKFFTDNEWATLEKTADEKDWLKKHSIEERYKGLDREVQLEEAVADEFSTWKREGKPDTPLGKVFAKLEEFFEAIRRGLRKVFGKDPTAEDIFGKVESGEVAERTPTEPGEVAKASKEPFERGMAIGMTQVQYERYQKLIEKRQAQDREKAEAKALAEIQKRQTKTWKDAEVAIRPEAVEDVNSRPDIAADKFLREGEKIDSDLVPQELRAGLPKEYFAKNGIHPDDAASYFGYTTGKDMLDHLRELGEKRKAANLRPEEYTRRLINMEIDKRLSEKFAENQKSAIEEAKEQALSETQLEMLHEEVLALGLQANAEFSITRAQMAQWTRETFGKLRQDDINSDSWIRDAGKAGRATEDFLLKGKVADAFRERQKQYIAISLAREAAEFEAAKKDFAKTTRRFQSKEVRGVNQEYTDFVQDLLADVGVNRRVGTETAATRHKKTFDQFVNENLGDGYELDVPDYIRAGEAKPVEQMTVEEFRDLKDSVDSLATVGRLVNKILVEGVAKDYADFKAEVLENIRTLPLRDPNKPAKWLYGFDASITRMEEIMKDLDLRQEHGPLFAAVIRPMAEAKHTEYSMTEDLSRRLKSIRGDFGKEWRKSLNDTIPNDFFHDPYYEVPVPFDLTRENMINIMLNFGNRSNIDKFLKGYASKDNAQAFEGRLRQMFDEHATKQDWDYVQNMWDTFNTWQKDSQKLYYDLGGGRKKWIQGEAVQTPHGEYAGGYWPVMYDPVRSRMGMMEDLSANALFGQNYTKATPSNHYTKERTGYVDRVNFLNTIEQIGSRMQQQIHDISYRRAVMDVAKIIKDPEIRGAIRKHYGPEYEKQLNPWLKDIANHFNMEEEAIGTLNSFMRRMRLNLMGSALGLNLRVIGSPDLGALNPAAIARYKAYPGADALIMEKSKEIPHTFRNMDRDFREQLENTVNSKGWKGMQADATRATLWPVVLVSQQFRKATFFDEFMKAKAKGMDDGAAGAVADSYVRERHGSGGLPDIPSIMRSNEFMKASTLFYGYFNTMYNWQRQMPTQARMGEYTKMLQTLYGSVLIGSVFGAALFNQQKEGDSWFKIVGKAITLQPLSTVPFVRDAANYFMEGNTARSPFATLLQASGALGTDVKNVWEGKKAKKPIQHFANTIGLYPGVPGMAQMGRTSQWVYDINTGRQPYPKNIVEWTRGIIGGETKLRK